MFKQWQGYWVCREHWEPRQPQDYVRGVVDNPTPPWAQPQPEDFYVFGAYLLTENSIMDSWDADYNNILTETNYPLCTEA